MLKCVLSKVFCYIYKYCSLLHGCIDVLCTSKYEELHFYYSCAYLNITAASIPTTFHVHVWMNYVIIIIHA